MTSAVIGFYVLCMLAFLAAIVCAALYACAQAVRLCIAAASAVVVRLRPRPDPTDPARRVGDRDRRRALGVLQHGYAEGRLDLAELDVRAGEALAARTAADLVKIVRDLPHAGPARLRSHELVAGLVLLFFSSTPVRVLGLCLVLSALTCTRLRPVPIAFAAGVLVAVSPAAALVLAAVLVWDRTFVGFRSGPVLRP